MWFGDRNAISRAWVLLLLLLCRVGTIVGPEIRRKSAKIGHFFGALPGLADRPLTGNDDGWGPLGSRWSDERGPRTQSVTFARFLRGELQKANKNFAKYDQTKGGIPTRELGQLRVTSVGKDLVDSFRGISVLLTRNRRGLYYHA